VNVVTPVLLPLAVTVTVCGVLKLDGVNVRLVGDAVWPEFPEDARLTVTLLVGAPDNASVKVPVLPCVIDRLEGVAVIDGVVTVVSCTVTVADVYPLPDAVNVVVPVPVVLAVRFTACGVPKFDGVKVRLVGDAVTPEFPDEAIVTVSFEVGAADSDRLKDPVPPWLTDRLVGVAVIDGVVVPPVAVQLTLEGGVLVPV
jgi:hypothetical protein